MRRVGANDITEALAISPGHDALPRAYWDLQVPDIRAKWAFQLLSAWGMAATMGDVIGVCHPEPPQRLAPNELAIRVCEVVDAAWNEMRHRGWIIQTESMVD